jgi:DNA replication protein DnaC
MDSKVDFESAARGLAAASAALAEPTDEMVRSMERRLSSAGWLREVAGERDFDAAARACAKVVANRRAGLFVWGGFGSGKTALVDALCSMLVRPPLWVGLGCAEDAELLDAGTWPCWNDEALGRCVVLDDLGAETTLSDFGIRRETAGEFVVRYHLRGTGRLFVTTNLSGQELEERYTMRVCSRIKDLMVPLHLTGADKRRWGCAPAKKGGAR